MKYLILIATGVIAVLFFFWKDVDKLIPVEKLKQGSGKNKQLSPSVDILQHWTLPEALKEVSGIAYLDEERFAAIQDEVGTLYIFNTTTQKIEKEISFGGAGDYEGLAVKDNIAYIATAGGSIYEVHMTSNPVTVKEYSTSLTAKNNVEGLCYDADNNRLLLAVKDQDPHSKEYKGVYGFDLTNNQFSPTPIYKLSGEPGGKKNKKSREIMPSAIGIHPLTKNLYVTDGPNARLLIVDNTGKFISLTDLGKKFAQPEGITFSPSGAVYISNEGNKDPGNIIQVSIGTNE